MLTPTLLFILKPPVPGKVKTRLAAEIGRDAALSAYRGMVAHFFPPLASRWPLEIHFQPIAPEREMCRWLGEAFPYFPQVEGNLGDKLKAAMTGAFSRGAEAVVFLGGDCPYVKPSTIREAAQALQESDVVIGPAEDGGYYLLALKKEEPRLFDEITWSSDSVCTQTLDRVKRLNLTVRLLEPLEDVDDAAGWRRASLYLRKGEEPLAKTGTHSR